ncbi:MAG: polysaccharide biosynthesis tyrosine autokinase [Candidatus Aminicenantales bacterium]
MENEEKLREINLEDYWRLILKRKWVAITFAGAVILLTAILSFLQTPQYESTATLLIEEETSRILSIDEALGDQAQVVRDLRGYNTQLQLLKSKSLAERVARRLSLLSRPEFGAGREAKTSLFAGIKYIITFRWLSSGSRPSEDTANPLIPANPYSRIANSLLQGIEVSPVRDTKLVQVSFTFPSAPLATEIVNTLAEEFIDFSVEKRYSATQQASAFLDETITTLRDDLAAKERELQQYGQDKDITFLSETESAAVSTFANLSQARDEAMLERIKAEAEYKELTDLEGEALPQLISDPAVQQLKTEYTNLRTEYQEKSRQLLPGHPEMMRIRARLDSLKTEIGTAAQVAEARVRAARQRENTITAQLNRQKADVARMKNNAILYNTIKSEVDSKRRLLNSLLERQSETQLSAQLKGLSASNISIIDSAEVPRRPVSPNKKNNLLMALLIGVFGGVGLCFLFDYLDDTLKGPEDVEKLSGLPSLGVIPYLPPEGVTKSKRYGAYMKNIYSYGRRKPEKDITLPEVKEIELINHLHPDIPLAEDYRTVRTSILLSQVDKPPKTIVFSSPLTQEGKTATVVNMAVSFAQLQEKVLVVDTDLRKPRLHRLLKVRNINGLTGYLTGKMALRDIIQKTFIENFWIIPSGPVPPNPAELLNSKKMKDVLFEIGQVFDIVLLDSPPVLAVIDSVIIASISDSVVMVVRGGKTRRKPFAAAVDELRKGRANIIGVVMNGVDLSKEGTYYTKYYRHYKYGVYGQEEGDKLEDSL